MAILTFTHERSSIMIFALQIYNDRDYDQSKPVSSLVVNSIKEYCEYR